MNTSNPNLTFALSDGIMEMSTDNLLITDNAKKDKLLLLITTICTITLSLSIIYKWTKAGELFYPVIGSILLVPNIGLLWKWYKEFRFVERVIKFNDIAKFKVLNIKLSGTKIGLIQLKDNKVRRIKMEHKTLREFAEYIDSKNIQVIQ